MEHPKALGPMLGYCAHLTRERMDARLAGSGITPTQVHVLRYLHGHQGTAPQCEVTAFLKVKPSTANGILDRMEERGLLTRSVSGLDARQRLISLTEKGMQQQERFQKNYLDTEEAALRGFTPAERETLFSLLEQVISNLEEDRDQ
jgi:DNA-binding MarR family transcriptional regulator